MKKNIYAYMYIFYSALYIYSCVYMHIYRTLQAALVVKNSLANAGDVRDVDCRFHPWVGKTP